MDKSIYHPIGPVGSILIGIALIAVHFAKLMPGVWAIGMLGFAFLFGGTIMLLVRIMNQKKTQLPK